VRAEPGAAADGEGAALSLICRVTTRLCALPLDRVVETMRPLPVEPVAGAPDFVRGLAIVRGGPIPVVDAARLLGGDFDGQPTRFVTVRAGDRRIALAVDAVLGVRALPAASRGPFPPMLGAMASDVVSAIGMLDARLLLVLETTRLLPESVWSEIEGGGA